MKSEPLRLTTTDGVVLEGEAAVPGSPRALAVLTHPHPQFGGNMRSIVPGALFEALPAADVACVRFNFRGVEGSSGSYANGVGEQHDVIAALDWIVAAAPSAPVFVAGWSFGADVALAVDDARLAAWVAVAAPLRIIDPTSMAAASDPRPKLLLVPQRDQYRPPDAAAAIVADWPSTTLETVPGADHFLVGRIDRVVERVTGFVDELVQ